MREDADLVVATLEPDEDRAAALSPIAALAPALALAACGGGGGAPPSSGGPGVIVAPPPPPAPVIADAQAARLLGQATMGITRESIARVKSLGYAGWLDEQFATPRAIRHWDWMVGAGFNAAANINGTAGYDPSVWRQLVTGQDQLRQRVGMALLEILVVGIDGLTSTWKAFGAAAYLDLLMDGAFGNFRALLESVSTNAAMAQYLTFLGNRKANASTGAVPDENYARELLQLFTIGVNRLNPDGSVQAGAAETYTQADVSGLARVFTGFNYDMGDGTTPDRLRRPLVVNAGQHETGAKSFLGATIAAGTDGTASLKQALDAIFAHPNVAPFVSRQLIQRLVTSNPSAGYVQRIGAVFENNGQGTRGDLKAVVRAILLDGEARDDAGLANAGFGKLREPIMRFTGWARAFGAASASDGWAIGDTSSATTRLGQSPGRAQSVFNFFRPGYTPPNTAIAAQGLVAPELQITNELSVVGYLNFMQGAIAGAGVGDVRADYTAILAKAGDAGALVDEVNLLLAAGQLSAPTVATIRGAVESLPVTATNGSLARVYIAIQLTLAAPEFIVQK